MRSQKHNQGELSELKIMIEKQVLLDLEKMAINSRMSIEEIVVIAIKRFRAGHGDYMQDIPALD